jgi:hypothetical protein
MKRQLYFALSIFIFPALADWQANKERSYPHHSPQAENEVKNTIQQRLDALKHGDVRAYTRSLTPAVLGITVG